MDALAIVGSIFIFVAALIHLLIFVMESVLWARPVVWKRFGLATQEHAEIVKPMAFNQGFYNVFLAIGAGLGLVLLGSTTLFQAGLALSIFAAGSMVLAATVLIASSPKLARAAIIQGLAPVVGIVFLVLSIVAG
ncbi:putative membrane protein [Salinibacterium sp. CAN_S4]|uniref:DUF1304 domain-containing protein n=1 Tax=Salinibacterium sp. CAN_S4 TaxID=2787727 RepID=UPI0018EF6BF2